MPPRIFGVEVAEQAARYLAPCKAIGVREDKSEKLFHVRDHASILRACGG